MCGSNGCHSNNACCPIGQIFKEDLCGNVANDMNTHKVWHALTHDYFQGTFEVFNAGTTSLTFKVYKKGGAIHEVTVPAMSSAAISVNTPDHFKVTGNGATGSKWCITLYKRVF